MRARPNIRLIEHAPRWICCWPNLADAGTPRRCLGARVRVDDGDITPWLASHTVLATGGLGQVYAQTTNPDAATGDGVAMAWRALPGGGHGIRAVPPHRAAGGWPRGRPGDRGAAAKAPYCACRAALHARARPARGTGAARHRGARDQAEMSRLDLPYVHLDISHRPRAWLDRHFPAVTALCAAHGIDIATQPMPVAPCAHYACGGVRADVDGATGIAGLRAGRSRAHRPAWRQPAGQQFAAGMRGDGTGGGKRHRRIGRCSKRGSLGGSARAQLPARPATRPRNAGAPDTIRAALRRLMQQAGIIRSDEGLADAAGRIAAWRRELPPDADPGRTPLAGAAQPAGCVRPDRRRGGAAAKAGRARQQRLARPSDAPGG